MISWKNILAFASDGNLTPDCRINKTDEQWRDQLSEEQFRIARQHGTEPASSSESCGLFEPGIYACVCCETLLFNAEDKYDSGTGWPSFRQPIKENAVSYYGDNSHGRQRIEARCNTCDAHLGHVFPDGPEPSGLRYCMNAVALKKVDATTELATLGGGCFWCTEAVFQQLRGVLSVESGYSGGSVGDPSYEAVCSGTTGHAEVVQVEYDPEEISYEDLLRVHLSMHKPTSLNQQGADKGTQYRSIILTHNRDQQERAGGIIEELQRFFDDPIVTVIQPFEAFYKAEDSHQNYFQSNSKGNYCQSVINPKLANLRKLFAEKLKK